jgi:putative transcriptional regulator
MIKHHPKDELLHGFVDGQLPASLSAAIAIHADMCPFCQDKIASITAINATASFEESHLHHFIVDSDVDEKELGAINFDEMIDAIVADDHIAQPSRSVDKKITVGDLTYTLPQAIKNIELGSFAQFGKLSRARFQLDEGEIHTSLLHIQPGGGVPEHTHKGYELTLLLAGEFGDERGDYVPGDFIMLDASNTHNPVSQKGCLCFTVANDSLHFTQGINRLLNPIGAFIY